VGAAVGRMEGFEEHGKLQRGVPPVSNPVVTAREKTRRARRETAKAERGGPEPNKVLSNRRGTSERKPKLVEAGACTAEHDSPVWRLTPLKGRTVR